MNRVNASAFIYRHRAEIDTVIRQTGPGNTAKHVCFPVLLSFLLSFFRADAQSEGKLHVFALK